MSKKYHYTYVIVDELSSDYYIGKHSTDDLDDGYMGSGAWVKDNADNPHLRKTIIGMFESSEEAYLSEKELVGDKWKTDPKCMNRMKGGKTSFFERETYSQHCMKVYGVDHHMKCENFVKDFRFPFKEEAVQAKAKERQIELYGGLGSSSEEIKSKVERTNTERYGAHHTLNTPNVEGARKSAIQEKYGTDNPFKNREKLEEVMLERHGVRNVMHLPEVKAKHKKSMESVDWSEVKERTKATNLAKYGTVNPLNLPHVKEKHKLRCKYGCMDNHIFDAGNLTKHMIKFHGWDKQQVRDYRKQHENEKDSN